MKKLFTSVFLGVAVFVSGNVFAREAIEYAGKTYVEKFSKATPQELIELKKQIKDAKELDNQLTAQFHQQKQNPFNDDKETYGVVFKNNDKLFIKIASGYYSVEVIDLYNDYYENFLKNFKKNIQLAHKLGDKRPEFENVLAKLTQQQQQQKVQPFFKVLKHKYEVQHELDYLTDEDRKRINDNEKKGKKGIIF